MRTPDEGISDGRILPKPSRKAEPADSTAYACIRDPRIPEAKQTGVRDFYWTRGGDRSTGVVTITVLNKDMIDSDEQRKTGQSPDGELLMECQMRGLRSFRRNRSRHEESKSR